MAAAREPELAHYFAGARPSARVPADLEVRLRTIVAEATRAWPELTIDEVRLVEAIARTIGDDVESGLGDLYVEDLALAIACADGVPNALAQCDRLCAGAIAAAVARVDRSPDLRDEVRQILWQRIFVGTAEQSPRIQSYAGRGPLAAWVAVAAQRVALDLRRSEARDGRRRSAGRPAPARRRAPRGRLSADALQGRSSRPRCARRSAASRIAIACCSS